MSGENDLSNLMKSWEGLSEEQRIQFSKWIEQNTTSDIEWAVSFFVNLNLYDRVRVLVIVSAPSAEMACKYAPVCWAAKQPNTRHHENIGDFTAMPLERLIASGLTREQIEVVETTPPSLAKEQGSSATLAKERVRESESVDIPKEDG